MGRWSIHGSRMTSATSSSCRSPSPLNGAVTRALGRSTSGHLTHSLLSVAVDDVSRRALLKGAGLLGVTALVPPQVLAWARAQAAAAETYLFFTPHEADVVREATARLIPGPTDDPTELGHPGAREAN